MSDSVLEKDTLKAQTIKIGDEYILPINNPSTTDNHIITVDATGGLAEWERVSLTRISGEIIMWNGAVITGTYLQPTSNGFTSGILNDWYVCNGQTVNNVTIPNMLIVPSSGLDLDTGYKILSRPEERQKLIDAGEEYARLFLIYKEETQ